MSNELWTAMQLLGLLILSVSFTCCMLWAATPKEKATPTDQEIEDEAKAKPNIGLVASSTPRAPAPVSVVHPEKRSTPEDHMRWLLDKVVNPGDYPQAVLYEQIRSTLACLDKVKELNQ